MVFVRDTSSCPDDNLCQTIFKSHHVRLCPGHDSGGIHKHGQDKLYMPFPHFMAMVVGGGGGGGQDLGLHCLHMSPKWTFSLEIVY